MNSDEYIEQLEKRVMELSIERDEAFRRIKELESEKEELLRKLKIYENPHTPPSLQIIRKVSVPEENKIDPKKRGAPVGHKGATRKRQEPDEIIDVVADHCESCGSTHIERLNNVEKTIIEDIPPPQKIKVTQYNRWEIKCLDCGHTFISKHEDCPREGNLGIYMLVYITMLKYHLRGVIRKIRDFLEYNNSFEISIMGINNALLRVGEACKGEYNHVLERIRGSKWVHIDETGMKVNGKKWWLWIFRSPDNAVLVVIRKSRGSNVPEDILGSQYEGAIVVDGWVAYNRYKKIQRCWAHLIREVDDLKEVSEASKKLSNSIHDKFRELKKITASDLSIEERGIKKVELDNGMEELVAEYRKNRELEKAVKYIENGIGSWYTCVLYPGMEPTNNLGEQAIREHVIMRKIIGTFRSESGPQNYQYIASLLAMWNLEGKNLFIELEKLLRQELCLK